MSKLETGGESSCVHDYKPHQTAMGTKCKKCIHCGKMVIRNKITARVRK